MISFVSLNIWIFYIFISVCVCCTLQWWQEQSLLRHAVGQNTAPCWTRLFPNTFISSNLHPEPSASSSCSFLLQPAVPFTSTCSFTSTCAKQIQHTHTRKVSSRDSLRWTSALHCHLVVSCENTIPFHSASPSLLFYSPLRHAPPPLSHRPPLLYTLSL